MCILTLSYGMYYTYRVMKEIQKPEPYDMCKNKNHWVDLIVWGKCKTCASSTDKIIKHKLKKHGKAI